MKLTPTEVKHARAVEEDMDLMIRAREYVHEPDSTPAMDVLALVHDAYPGGITQFYLNNRF